MNTHTHTHIIALHTVTLHLSAHMYCVLDNIVDKLRKLDYILNEVWISVVSLYEQ